MSLSKNIFRSLFRPLLERWQARRSRPSAAAQPQEIAASSIDFDLSNSPPCPHCGMKDVTKKIYGKPVLTRQIIEGLESGTIISGGCMIHGGAPEWHCNRCNKEFSHLNFDPTTAGDN